MFILFSLPILTIFLHKFHFIKNINNDLKNTHFIHIECVF